MNLKEQFELMNLKTILDFIPNKQEENLNLDFKTINDANLKNKDDKKNLSKSFSGFANSSGGLLVWGIDARKNEDNIDCACERKEISNLKLFISRINELTSRATYPIIDEIEHKPIYSNGNDGYAVTYVPECDSGPYMAKLGEDRYYKRSGDSFYRMEHYDISDMFGKRRKPILILSGRFVQDGNTSTIFIGIKNEGRGIAKIPFLAFKCPLPFKVSSYGLDGNGLIGLPKLFSYNHDLPNQFGGVENFVIYPNTTKEITKLVFDNLTNSKIVLPNKVRIEYEVAAENMLLKRNILEIELK